MENQGGITMSTSRRVSRFAASSLQAVTLATVLALTAPSPALASEQHHTVVSADKVVWNPGPPTLPSGAQIAVLHGSPAKEGPFVIRLKFPADFQIAPHRHSKEEHVTVISGRFGMATGEKLDRQAAPLLQPGSFVRIPQGAAHFAWTDQETVVQINGVGPFDVIYVNPDDDPRKRKAAR
jgi:quercetin dioxygenase-like cupin family protein